MLKSCDHDARENTIFVFSLSTPKMTVRIEYTNVPLPIKNFTRYFDSNFYIFTPNCFASKLQAKCRNKFYGCTYFSKAEIVYFNCEKICNVKRTSGKMPSIQFSIRAFESEEGIIHRPN